MADIIKTWPACVSARTVARAFSPTLPPWHCYYFTLGRGRPKEKADRLWFTYQGRILGYFKIEGIIVNDGSLPALRRLDGATSDWQMRKDAKIAVCPAPITRIKERVFMGGFRGWRYFDFEAYRQTSESRIRF